MFQRKRTTTITLLIAATTVQAQNKNDVVTPATVVIIPENPLWTTDSLLRKEVSLW